MIARDVCEAAFADAVTQCNPSRLVRTALARRPVSRPLLGLAVGKAARAMAHGVDDVARGLCITTAGGGESLPPRWELHVASHPLPDESSVAAGLTALAFVESAGEGDTILALISGGASALLEVPATGITLDELPRRTAELMASGASIHELNRERTELSAIKGGKLADRSNVPVVTFAISDVVGDDPRVIGSGPTVRDGDRVEVIGTMALFGEAIQAALHARGIRTLRELTPRTGDVTDVAAEVAAAIAAESENAALVAWGEPTVRVPARPGRGGRATQLALLLARQLRGSERSAFVAASDGDDARTGAAGAYVDGSTWDAIARAGIDPDASLAGCDAVPALAAVGAMFSPGPTGINHADVMIVG